MSEPRVLHRVFDGKAWGYVDATGQEVIAPRFTSAEPFAEGRATVMVKGKWGLVDERGESIAEPRHDLAWSFHEGLGVLGTKTRGKWRFAYVDGMGASVLEVDFQQAFPFYEGRARVGIRRPGTKAVAGGWFCDYGYINESGNVVIPTRFPLARDFSEGLAPVQEPGDERRQGVLAPDGTWVIEPRFKMATDFREGLAGVVTDENDALYIDRSGREAFRYPIKYLSVEPFSDGLVSFPGAANSHHKGYIDREGRVAIAPRPGLGARFSEGLAVFGDGSGAFGYVDKQGAEVLAPRLFRAEAFREGWAHVVPDLKRPGAMACIDREGRWVWLPPKPFAALPKLVPGPG